MISTWIQDVRYALRQLRRAPGFTLTAVLTLALGIGANTAIFTLVHGILQSRLPVKDPGSLVRLGEKEDCCVMNIPSMGYGSQNLFPYDEYKQLRDHTPEFEDLAAMEAPTGNHTFAARRANSDGAPFSSRAEFVSGNYFRMFGLQPFAGRNLTPSDDTLGAAPVAMLSYQAWQRDYAGDPSVVGSSFLLNTQPVTIVGITPANYNGDRLTDSTVDFYLPISQEPFKVSNKPEVGWLFLIGRVKPGTELGPLSAKLSGLARQSLAGVKGFDTEHGKKELAKLYIVLTPGGAGIASLQHYAEKGLYLLMGISAMVLLIACANIANLMLARGMARRAEVSIRMALGAARMRLVRQMLTESIVLACAGGLAGVLVAYAGANLLLKMVFPQATAMPMHASPSPVILIFALAVSLLTGMVFGLAPAWATTYAAPSDALRGANRSTGSASLLQRALVVVQAALSLVLLVGAGLLGKSLMREQNQDIKLGTTNRVIVHISPLNVGYKPEQLPGLYSQIEDKFHALPVVKHVGLSVYTPLEGSMWTYWSFVQGEPVPEQGHYVNTMVDRASPEYFDAVGQRIVQGRAFTSGDTATSPKVGIVNQAFVKKHFKPGENPIGRRFGTNEPKYSGDFEIVGVVEDAMYANPKQATMPMYFMPMMQPITSEPPKEVDTSVNAGAIILDVKALAPGLEQEVRKTLASINPDLTVDKYETFTQQIAGQFNQDRMMAQLTLLFGLLALALAAIGLYGVTAYTVERRSSEIGLRMALGAERGSVVAMVMRGAILQAGIGLAVGIPAALLCVRFVQSQLYDTTGHDMSVLLGATATLSVAACIAAFIPAQRAAAMDPAKSLRTE